MLLKKNKGGLKTRSQPKIQRASTKTVRQEEFFPQPQLIPRGKHTPTNSCLMDRTIRGHRQRRSLQDITPSTKNQRVELRSRQQGSWISQFDFQMEIGQGAFGEVWKVKDQKCRLRALKVMHKSIIIAKNSCSLVNNERNILNRLAHNGFVVNCLQASQDQQHLYLLMEYMPGGDLRYLMYRYRRRFTEGQAKFLICCLILALEHLHANGIIHRDVKPENLVMDAKGYLRITDMGISRSIYSKGECDNSGTPAYMAPEVFSQNTASFCADYYALGVVTFQLLNGRRPYDAKTRQAIVDEMRLGKDIVFYEGLSTEAIHFTKGLLQKDPTKRLGHADIKEIMEHRWFSGIEWPQFRRKNYTSPFRNEQVNAASLQEYNRKLDHSPEVKNARWLYSSQNLFKGYNFKVK